MDALGLFVALVVHAANIQDYDGARQVLQKAHRNRAAHKKYWLTGFTPRTVWPSGTSSRFNLFGLLSAEEQKGFVVLPKRWIVERTFAWLGRFRLLSREYEHLTQTSESDYIASIRMMLQRLDRYRDVGNS